LNTRKGAARFIAREIGPSTKVNIPAYHRSGESRNSRLEGEGKATNINPRTAEQMAVIQKTIETRSLTVSIGG
jgi:hypothetical protein